LLKGEYKKPDYFLKVAGLFFDVSVAGGGENPAAGAID
jgi:hypothetical protein